MEILLKWKSDTNESIPCPDLPEVDPYTGEMSYRGCLVNHFKTVTRDHAKVFSSKEEMEAFKEKAPQNCYDWNH